MYVDKNLLISDEQDLGDSQSPDTVLSSNSVDLGAAKDLSKGKQMYVVIIVDESFVGNTTVQFEVITDSVEALNSTPTIHVSTALVSVSTLVASMAPIILPVGNPLGVSEQFLGRRFRRSSMPFAAAAGCQSRRRPRANRIFTPRPGPACPSRCRRNAGRDSPGSPR